MLTPQQRIEAYEFAMEEIKEDVMECICLPMNRKVRDMLGGGWNNFIEAGRIYGMMNELRLFKPECRNAGVAWLVYDEEGNKTREIILLFCIEMAKDQLTLPHGGKKRNV